MGTKEEQLILRAKVEGQMLEHYEKVMEGMVRWCIFEQDEVLDTTMKAFGLSSQELTIKALETVLAKYKGDKNV